MALQRERERGLCQENVEKMNVFLSSFVLLVGHILPPLLSFVHNINQLQQSKKH